MYKTVQCEVLAFTSPWSCPLVRDKWAWSRSRDLFKFWEIINIISEMVQDTDIVTLED